MIQENICIFSAQYLPNVGGVERYTYNLAKELTQKGVKVTIVASNTHNSPDYEEKEGIRIYRLPCVNLINGRFPVLIWNKKTRKILDKVAKEQYQLVLVNTRFYIHSLVGVIFGKKNADKCIVVEHGTSHLSVNNSFFDFLERIFEHSITWLVKRFCKSFYGVSEACNEWLKHFHINAKSTLYNAIDISLMDNIIENDTRDMKEELAIPINGKIITFTGRILPEKGVQQLLEAFKNVSRRYSNVYLVMAGDGPLLEDLKKQKVERAIFLGQVEFNTVVKLLDASEIFCLPSVSEGMPTSVLEAIACKNFVITTARGGAKEIILNDEFGIIMVTNTVEEVEAALEKALSHETYCQNAVKKSYERLKEKFTWAKVAEKVMGILEE